MIWWKHSSSDCEYYACEPSFACSYVSTYSGVIEFCGVEMALHSYPTTAGSPDFQIIGQSVEPSLLRLRHWIERERGARPMRTWGSVLKSCYQRTRIRVKVLHFFHIQWSFSESSSYGLESSKIPGYENVIILALDPYRRLIIMFLLPFCRVITES